MFKLPRKRQHKMPDMQISPMIDMIFLLLVFFIISTMYMTQLKTVSLQLPPAQNSAVQKKSNHTVSIKADNSLWLDDKTITLDKLKDLMTEEVKRNTGVSVVIRGDKKVNYGTVMEVLDTLKGVGITKFGMATEGMK